MDKIVYIVVAESKDCASDMVDIKAVCETEEIARDMVRQVFEFSGTHAIVRKYFVKDDMH